MKRILWITVAVFNTFTSIAQSENCPCSSDEDYQAFLLNGLTGVEYRNPVTGYEGVQYLRDWAYGDIMLTSGDVIRKAMIRYDCYLDELLWLRIKDYRKAVLNKDDIVAFRLYNDGFYPESFFVKKRIRLPFLSDSAMVFVHELVKGNIEFFAYRNVKVEPVQNRLFNDTKYVIGTTEKDYLISLRRKNLLSMPFIDREKMKKILRQNRIPLRNNEQGMAKAISLYNQQD